MVVLINVALEGLYSFPVRNTVKQQYLIFLWFVRNNSLKILLSFLIQFFLHTAIPFFFSLLTCYMA